MQALVVKPPRTARFSEPRLLRINCVEDVTATRISGDSRADSALRRKGWRAIGAACPQGVRAAVAYRFCGAEKGILRAVR